MKTSRSNLWPVLKQTATEFNEDGALKLSAALAYYSVFSIAPLLVIAVAIAGRFLDADTVKDHLGDTLKDSLGPGAFAVQDMIDKARQPTKGLWASIGGIAMLLLGASGVFGQLQEAMNTVWGVKRSAGRGVRGFVKDRFLSIAMVLGTGFLLLVSMLLTATLEGAAKFAGSSFGVAPEVLASVTTIITFVVVWGLFAAIFKVLPDARIEWRDVASGSLATAALFVVGKFAIAWYLGREATSSPYGAAGSLALVLIWVYYSSIILLFGAEFTQVRAHSLGRDIKPEAGVRVLPDPAPAPEAPPPQSKPAAVSPLPPGALSGSIPTKLATGRDSRLLAVGIGMLVAAITGTQISRALRKLASFLK